MEWSQWRGNFTASNQEKEEPLARELNSAKSSHYSTIISSVEALF